MGVDGAGLAFTPAQGDQVVFAITSVYQVTCVSESPRNISSINKIIIALFPDNLVNIY